MVPATTESAYFSRTDYLRSTTRVLAEGDFWLIIASFTPVYMALGAILIHMIPHFTDIGLSPARSDRSNTSAPLTRDRRRPPFSHTFEMCG